MHRISFLLALCLLPSPNQGGQKPLPRPPVEISPSDQMLNTESRRQMAINDLLGRDREVQIEKAKRINIFRVEEFVRDPLSQKEKGRKYFADYEVLGHGKLSKEKSKQLKGVLLDPGNYMDEEFVNKCTFTATIGLEIITKKRKLNVLVSYRCRKILFLNDGKEFYRDLISAEPYDQIARAFLKDLPKL
ncbi:MAG TPA: hypothetical protein VLL54_05975 [Pyrinomonadaceae bacterium]|nr:hypothetical protein [Pyrinomonadaceae bacterium]